MPQSIGQAPGSFVERVSCGVKVSGPGLSDAVSGTDPLKDESTSQVAL
jgi:hypothetical protein